MRKSGRNYDGRLVKKTLSILINGTVCLNGRPPQTSSVDKSVIVIL